MSGTVLSINPASARSDIFGPMITTATGPNPIKTMKKILQLRLAVALALAAAVGTARLPAQETNAAPQRIGVYDSRAVAYAWFWSDAFQRRLQEQMRTARAAKAAGQTNRWQELGTALRQRQEEMHREVFSTAPAAGALADLGGRIPGIEKQAGVTALVSKWDAAALQKYPGAEPVDVTDRLVREFKPAEKQQQVIREILKQKPLPLEECNELIRKGEI